MEHSALNRIAQVAQAQLEEFRKVSAAQDAWLSLVAAENGLRLRKRKRPDPPDLVEDINLTRKRHLAERLQSSEMQQEIIQKADIVENNTPRRPAPQVGPASVDLRQRKVLAIATAARAMVVQEEREERSRRENECLMKFPLDKRLENELEPTLEIQSIHLTKKAATDIQQSFPNVKQINDEKERGLRERVNRRKSEEEEERLRRALLDKREVERKTRKAKEEERRRVREFRKAVAQEAAQAAIERERRVARMAADKERKDREEEEALERELQEIAAEMDRLVQEERGALTLEDKGDDNRDEEKEKDAADREEEDVLMLSFGSPPEPPPMEQDGDDSPRKNSETIPTFEEVLLYDSMTPTMKAEKSEENADEAQRGSRRQTLRPDSFMRAQKSDGTSELWIRVPSLSPAPVSARNDVPVRSDVSSFGSDLRTSPSSKTTAEMKGAIGSGPQLLYRRKGGEDVQSAGAVFTGPVPHAGSMFSSSKQQCLPQGHLVNGHPPRMGGNVPPMSGQTPSIAHSTGGTVQQRRERVGVVVDKQKRVHERRREIEQAEEERKKRLQEEADKQAQRLAAIEDKKRREAEALHRKEEQRKALVMKKRAEEETLRQRKLELKEHRERKNAARIRKQKEVEKTLVRAKQMEGEERRKNVLKLQQEKEKEKERDMIAAGPFGPSTTTGAAATAAATRAGPIRIGVTAAAASLATPLRPAGPRGRRMPAAAGTGGGIGVSKVSRGGTIGTPMRVSSSIPALKKVGGAGPSPLRPQHQQRISVGRGNRGRASTSHPQQLQRPQCANPGRGFIPSCQTPLPKAPLSRGASLLLMTPPDQRSAQKTPKSQNHDANNYEMTPYRTEREQDELDSDDEDLRRREKLRTAPTWARSRRIQEALERQGKMDPDNIFLEEKSVDLDSLIKSITSKKRRKQKVRGSSANWFYDGVTWKEELEYKKGMGYS